MTPQRWNTMAALVLGVAWMVAATAAQAGCPSYPTTQRFEFNAAGDEVTDRRTGLVWARCSLGQSWNGSACGGSASELTHQQALQQAQANSGWRLPNAKELATLADKGCETLAIDSVAFPATESSWYWTSTPGVASPAHAWAVNFGDGYVSLNARSGVASVRLVRSDR